ncbi:DUF115 domain-containing protein [Alkaliphilus sp. MSJ-5]|uniref:DUF115 domain-containing protein n=1 Tax=Alkaliphilus flagellatus TaxID=2841507 RepID=A0ABS6G2F9_9FIRM|nr:6-hydroxymethylpterin diphosphokinase MptE-like protein [Alkaliphilus flagellatus]MBU5676660.1 DUF115 domain-containing protein [Alkaliphilus flagellatus]
MLMIDNINILKRVYLNTWKRIKSLEDSINKDLIKLEETRKGQNTLFCEKEGRKTYIHSKYDPVREAEAIIQEYKDIKDDATIIFYGTGLGYHIDIFLEKYPNINYYIYEPVPELLYQYLNNKSLEGLKGKNLKDIVLGTDIQDTVIFLNNIIDKNRKDIILVEFPVHKQMFPKEYENFLDLFKTIVKDKRAIIHTDYAFQERWIINSMKNFKYVLSTPNILIEKKGEFKNKPAILVAAGPSLNEEIENIRYIKENGLAYIFSVGSAINTLMYNNIYPDAATTYDPTERNQIVFEKVNEMKIRDIPMIFGTSVGYETLENYLGNKYHMITSQDTIANYYLKTKENQSINIVQDAPSIAVVTFQLLSDLGFNPIILVGQNLGYIGKEKHSEGVHYSKQLTEEEIEKGIWVKDVYGNEILADDGFNRMRQHMEFYIGKLLNTRVINTTKGGAHIEGAEFIELETVMKNDLTEKIVEDNWLNGDKTSYDEKYLDFKLRKMDIEYDKALKTNKNYKNILNKIDRSINNRNFSQTENLYIKLDKELRKIENNDFYKTFILPMNRVQYKTLVDSIDRLNEINNHYNKGKKIVESFRRFMDICEQCIEAIKPIYEEMKKDIEYINQSNEEGEKYV